MEVRFSERAKAIKGSAVRNKLFDNPDIISFSAGKPEESLFPKEDIAGILANLIRSKGSEALQYSDTEGFYELRAAIAGERMAAAGVSATADQIALTSGSQEGIELSAKIFINEGDIIICESPSYTGAFNAFNAYGPKYIGVPIDEDGMILTELEKVLAATPNAKMIYTIPDFQNPTGVTMSNERRKTLAELAAKYRIPVIEDCPYGDLIFEGERHPAVKSFDKEGWVVLLGSFSKIFCPGLRLGWICASDEILQKYILAKQASNLQASSLDELLALAYMTEYDMAAHIAEINDTYRERRDTMIAAIEKYFPKTVKYTVPHGGFFVWLELDKEIDSAKLLLEAAEKYKVVFIPGADFFADPGHDNFIRLSYSFVTPQQIEEGIKRLGELLK